MMNSSEVSLNVSFEKEFKDHCYGFQTVLYISSINRIICGDNSSGVMKVLNPTNQIVESTLQGHKGAISALIQLNSEHFLSTSHDSTAILWDIFTFQKLRTFKGHRSEILSALRLSNVNFVTGDSEGRIKFWNRNERKPYVDVLDKGCFVNHLFLLKSYKNIFLSAVGPPPSSSSSSSSDSSSNTTSFSSTVFVNHRYTKKKSFDENEDCHLFGLKMWQFTPICTLVKCYRRIRDHPITSINSFYSKGLRKEVIVTTGGSCCDLVVFWDIENETVPLKVMKSEESLITSSQIFRNQYMITGHEFGTIKIFKLMNFKKLAELKAHSYTINGMDRFGKNTEFFTASSDGNVNLISIKIEQPSLFSFEDEDEEDPKVELESFERRIGKTLQEHEMKMLKDQWLFMKDFYEKKVEELRNELNIQKDLHEQEMLRMKDVVDEHQRITEKFKEERNLLIQQIQQDRLKMFHINKKEIIKGEYISSGAFGKVYAGIWKSHRSIALKEMKMQAQFNKNEILNEFQKSVSLIHRRVLRIYGYYQQDHETIVLVMEKMKTDVSKYLKMKKTNLYDKFILMKKMTEGILFLHQNHLIHRDIKSMNFLVNAQGTEIKICDFGLIKTASQSATFISSNNKGSIPWMAPEIMDQDAQYSVYSDVYALGMTFYEVLFEKMPFQGMMSNQAAIMKAVLMNNQRPKMNYKRLPSPLISLIKKMWHQNPKKRYNTQQVYGWFVENEKTFEYYKDFYFPTN